MSTLIRQRLQHAALAIGLCATALAFPLPDLAWARPGDTCQQNAAAINPITICVTAVERPAGGCGDCSPTPTSDVCPTSGQPPFSACCSNLSEAVFLAVPGDTIGVYTPTSEPPVAGAADVGPNVIISGPFGSPFRSNQGAPPHAGLRIEECHNAKINAGDPSSPVIDIEPGAGNIIVNGLDVIGGTVGILVQNSGTAPTQPGTVLKAIRAENNFDLGAGAGIKVTGNRNEVSGSIATSNDTGFQVSSNSNLIRSNRANGNVCDGFLIDGNANDLRGNEANNNGCIGFNIPGSGNLLRTNQSNRSPQGATKENDDSEYSFGDSTTQDCGGNKKDNLNFVGTLAGSACKKRYVQGSYE